MGAGAANCFCFEGGEHEARVDVLVSEDHFQAGLNGCSVIAEEPEAVARERLFRGELLAQQSDAMSVLVDVSTLARGTSAKQRPAVANPMLLPGGKKATTKAEQFVKPERTHDFDDDSSCEEPIWFERRF